MEYKKKHGIGKKGGYKVPGLCSTDMKKRTGMAAFLLACAAFAGIAGGSAHAEQSVAGPSAGFDKYLVMDEKANVPNVQFSYTITHDPSLALPAQDQKPEIFEGIGTPTIGSAVFTPQDPTWTSVQPNGATASVQTKTQPGMDELTLGEGEKYAKKTVLIDLSSVTFTAPGIYRYAIREQEPSKELGFSMRDPSASSNILYLDVYINSDETGQLKASGSVLHRTAEVTPGVDQDTEYDGGFGTDEYQVKPSGFVNEYTTQDLELKKKVTGNQGDRNRYFVFSVEISDAGAGSLFDTDLTAAEAAVQIDGQRFQNPSRLTADEEGNVSAKFYLKNGQSVRILGLPFQSQTSLEEEIEAEEGYQVSYQVFEGGSLDDLKEGGNGEVQGACAGPLKTGNVSRQVLFINYRNGIVPTGVLLETAPVLGMIALAAAALFLLEFLRRRRV